MSLILCVLRVKGFYAHIYLLDNMLGRGYRRKATARFTDSLQAQKLDDDGLPIKQRGPTGTQSRTIRGQDKAEPAALKVSDSNDDEYATSGSESSAESSDEDSDINLAIGNAEVHFFQSLSLIVCLNRCRLHPRFLQRQSRSLRLGKQSGVTKNQTSTGPGPPTAVRCPRGLV